MKQGRLVLEGVDPTPRLRLHHHLAQSRLGQPTIMCVRSCNGPSSTQALTNMAFIHLQITPAESIRECLCVRAYRAIPGLTISGRPYLLPKANPPPEQSKHPVRQTTGRSSPTIGRLMSRRARVRTAMSVGSRRIWWLLVSGRMLVSTRGLGGSHTRGMECRSRTGYHDALVFVTR
jgi:hypothetical protein